MQAHNPTSEGLVSSHLASGINVTIYLGEDGLPVIEIDGPDQEKFLNPDSSPKVRIYLNDARIYNGTPYQGGSTDDE